jgi:hypothetical protein
MFSNINNNLTPILITKNRRTDNNSTILFTNARDEPNIAEWVAHHLLLGFNKIVIFDHLSKIPINEFIGTNFNNKLQVIRVEGTGNIKLNLMKQAVDIASKQNYSWMLYLDSDEFLFLRHSDVKNYLHIFNNADAIGINWLLFGTSGFQKQPKGLLTENFVRSELFLNSHVKSFVRPSCVLKINNPHYYVISDSSRYYSGNGSLMKMGPFSVQPYPFTKSPCYIAHYYTQSAEEHMRRKSRHLDDGSVGKNQMLEDVHKHYNNAINVQLKRNFSQKTKELLLKYNITL